MPYVCSYIYTLAYTQSHCFFIYGVCILTGQIPIHGQSLDSSTSTSTSTSTWIIIWGTDDVGDNAKHNTPFSWDIQCDSVRRWSQTSHHIANFKNEFLFFCTFSYIKSLISFVIYFPPLWEKYVRNSP